MTFRALERASVLNESLANVVDDEISRRLENVALLKEIVLFHLKRCKFDRGQVFLMNH
jgi:hypothetical protein